MVNQSISIDIVRYLLDKKGYSIEEIANITCSSVAHINSILGQKENLTSDELNFISKKIEMKIWEILDQATSKENLSPNLQNKIKICKELKVIAKRKI